MQNSFDIAAGDVAWTFNDTFTVLAGAEWKKYANAGQEYRRASEFAIPAMPAGVTMSSLSEQLTGYGKHYGGVNVPTGWVVPDFDAVAKAYGIYSGVGVFQLQGCPTGLSLENRPTNVSKNAYNATLYYEDAKVSARVSVSYRSNYLIAVPSGNQGSLITGRRQDYQDADYVPATTNVDANVSYQLTEKLKISLEALNLTDEQSQQRNDTIAQRVWTNHHFGRQFYFGTRYAF